MFARRERKLSAGPYEAAEVIMRPFVLALIAVGSLLVGCSSSGEDGSSDDEASSELRRRRRPDASAPVEVDAAPPPPVTPPPPPAANLYGFKEGATIIGKGIGDDTRNDGPSYKCHRVTHGQLPCGGWVKLSAGDAGETVVTFHAGGHYDWWSNVAGHHYLEGMNQVLPPSYSDFWDVSGAFPLDANGHGELHIYSAHGTRVAATAPHDGEYHFDVQAEAGAITVRFRDTIGEQWSCNRDEETCTFKVLPQ